MTRLFFSGVGVREILLLTTYYHIPVIKFDSNSPFIFGIKLYSYAFSFIASTYQRLWLTRVKNLFGK